MDFKSQTCLQREFNDQDERKQHFPPVSVPDYLGTWTAVSPQSLDSVLRDPQSLEQAQSLAVSSHREAGWKERMLAEAATGQVRAETQEGVSSHRHSPPSVEHSPALGHHALSC